MLSYNNRGSIRNRTIIPLDAAFSALERVFKPSVDTSALATVTQINDLNPALAGQSQQLAELQQAVLILAKSAKGVETGIEVIKKQTAPRVKDWKSIRKEMNVIWRDIIDDTTFFNADARSTAQGRGLQSLFSFGTAAPALMHAAKTECRSHIKQVRSAIAKLKQLFEYAQAHYSSDLKVYLDTCNRLRVHENSWTIRAAMTDSFCTELQTELLVMRGFVR